MATPRAEAASRHRSTFDDKDGGPQYQDESMLESDGGEPAAFDTPYVEVVPQIIQANRARDDEAEFLRAKARRRTEIRRTATQRRQIEIANTGVFQEAWATHFLQLPVVEAGAVPAHLLRQTAGSHAIFSVGGFIACRACGLSASERLGELRDQCKRRCLKGCGVAMKRLWKGKLPASYKA